MIAVGVLDTGVDHNRVLPARWASTDRRGVLVEDGSPRDPEGHGTATAREILAHAPDAHLYVASVIHGGDVIARIVSGLRWLIDLSADIVCLPLGFAEPNTVLDQLIGELCTRGSLVVAAAGNGGAGRLREPARSPDVLAVGSCDDAGVVQRISGSEFRPAGGIHKPDLVHPSTRGTSVSSAAVAGIAASLWEANPAASSHQIRAALCETAHPLSRSQRHRAAHGMVDADEAHALLAAERAGPGESRRPVSRARPYRDPRLLRQLDDALPGIDVTAVLVGRHTEVVRGTAEALRTRIERDEPLVASAADVDAWHHDISI